MLYEVLKKLSAFDLENLLSFKKNPNSAIIMIAKW